MSTNRSSTLPSEYLGLPLFVVIGIQNEFSARPDNFNRVVKAARSNNFVEVMLQPDEWVAGDIQSKVDLIIRKSGSFDFGGSRSARRKFTKAKKAGGKLFYIESSILSEDSVIPDWRFIQDLVIPRTPPTRRPISCFETFRELLEDACSYRHKVLYELSSRQKFLSVSLMQSYPRT